MQLALGMKRLVRSSALAAKSGEHAVTKMERSAVRLRTENKNNNVDKGKI